MTSWSFWSLSKSPSNEPERGLNVEVQLGGHFGLLSYARLGIASSADEM